MRLADTLTDYGGSADLEVTIATSVDVDGLRLPAAVVVRADGLHCYNFMDWCSADVKAPRLVVYDAKGQELLRFVLGNCMCGKLKGVRRQYLASELRAVIAEAQSWLSTFLSQNPDLLQAVAFAHAMASGGFRPLHGSSGRLSISRRTKDGLMWGYAEVPMAYTYGKDLSVEVRVGMGADDEMVREVRVDVLCLSEEAVAACPRIRDRLKEAAAGRGMELKSWWHWPGNGRRPNHILMHFERRTPVELLQFLRSELPQLMKDAAAEMNRLEARGAEAVA